MTRPEPRISVVIPTHNGSKTLPACLAAVKGQTRAAAEVIVVDDASTDDSRAIAERSGARVLAFETNRGPAAARNAGAASATGDVLFFLDSDLALAPDALANASWLLREHPECAVVQGIYEPRPLFPDGPVEQYKTLCEHHWRRRGLGVASATFVALAAVRRPVFEEVGGFDERIREVEDIEFGTRLPARYGILTTDMVTGRHDDVDRFGPYLVEHLRRAHKFGVLLAGELRARRQAPEPRTRRVDLATVTAMACCALAVITLPPAAVDGRLVAAPLVLMAGFAAIDRGLFGLARREYGTGFAGYAMAMQFLMHTTQFAGMLTGALHGVARAARHGRTGARPEPVR